MYRYTCKDIYEINDIQRYLFILYLEGEKLGNLKNNDEV